MNPIKSRAGLGLINFLVMTVFLGLTLYAQEGEHYPQFSLQLSGEARIVALGDINTALRTFNDNAVFEYIRKNNPPSDEVHGTVTPLRNAFFAGAIELQVDLSRRIGLGISFSNGNQREREDTLTYRTIRDVTWTDEFFYRSAIWIRPPLKMSLYYQLWCRSVFSSFISGGIGYYRGGLRQQYNLTTSGGYTGYDEWTHRYWETETKATLGFHLGGGLEWRLSRPVSLIAEIQYRYARIGPLRGLTQTESSFPWSYEERGYLYFFTRENPIFGQRHADLEVWDVPPDASTDFIMDIRKAKLDLSGVSLQIGIKIGLF